LLGFFVVDYVIGKHAVIDYSVALEPDGRVKAVEVLEYREAYGSEITSHSWLHQFDGKTSRDPVTIDKDIRNISGATLSSDHVAKASSGSWLSMRPVFDSARRARPLLGTFVEVMAGGVSRDRLNAAIEKAFAAVAKVHRLMSFHESDSDVSRLNRS